MVKGSVITAEMRKAIGTWRFPEFPPEVADIWGIKRYVAATGDPNPLWQDQEYASKTRWGGIIAPPTFVEVFSPAMRSCRETFDGLPADQNLPFKLPFEMIFMGGEEFEFFVPIRPGDAILCKSVLGNIYQKQSGSTGGRLLFIREDKEYYNQKSELLAKTNWTTILLEVAPKPPPVTSSVSERTVKPSKMNPVQVYFEDVTVGMLIPPMEKHITIVTIGGWGGAVGELNRDHFDAEYVRRVYGLPNATAHGPLNGAYLAQLMTNWIGVEGVLKKHCTQYRGNVFPGDTISFQGKVAKKWVEQGENFVECETWAENQYGMKISLGRSVVTLPSKGQVPG